MAENSYLGYLKYDGKLTEEGIFDAASASLALKGFDKTLRYFVEQQRPGLVQYSLPMPVRIDKGSWIASLPTSAVGWIATAVGSGATLWAAAYAAEAGKKMAQSDFKDVGLKDVFRKAFEALAWAIKLGKHLGNLAHKNVEKLKWKGEEIVSVPNAQGDYLDVPAEFLAWYLECPNSLLNEIAVIIEEERRLVVGYRSNGQMKEEVITIKEKGMFSVIDADAGLALFPELKHGMHVTLDGVVTRANGITNTIGLRYNDHILTCRPAKGKNVSTYKECLFLPCRIFGTISREDEKHNVAELNRPWIAFDDLRILYQGNDQPKLF